MTAVEIEADVEQQQADACRYLAGRDFTPAEVASALGLPVAAVRRVLAPRVDAKPKGSRPVGRPRLLNAERVAEARRLRAEGMSYPAIGRVLGVNRETVRLALQHAQDAPGVDAHPMCLRPRTTTHSRRPAGRRRSPSPLNG